MVRRDAAFGDGANPRSAPAVAPRHGDGPVGIAGPAETHVSGARSARSLHRRGASDAPCALAVWAEPASPPAASGTRMTSPVATRCSASPRSGEQLGVGEHLAPAGLDDARPRHERIAGRRRQAVDRDVRRQHVAAHREGGEAARGVDHSADHRRVKEAGVLAEVGAPRQLQLRATRAGVDDLEAGPEVERRRHAQGDDVGTRGARCVHPLDSRITTDSIMRRRHGNARRAGDNDATPAQCSA